MQSKEEITKRLEDIEALMSAVGFWNDKEVAQATIREYEELKNQLEGVGKFDKRPALLTVFAGAGGTDAEDFARMLLEMYFKYAQGQGWGWKLLHENQNDHGGYRNVTVEIDGKVYGNLQYESGVHRLVRISPFNAQKKRHTAFAMVEVVPKLSEMGDIEIPESDIEVEFSKSGGPGGQNVNKRETAVRARHIPTDIAVHVDTERTQGANRDKALELLRSRVYHRLELERKKREEGLSISKTTSNEWGNQIRSYVLHPYQLVKDHRTSTEARNVEEVFEGDIQVFIDAMKKGEGSEEEGAASEV